MWLHSTRTYAWKYYDGFLPVLGHCAAVGLLVFLELLVLLVFPSPLVLHELLVYLVLLVHLVLLKPSRSNV